MKIFNTRTLTNELYDFKSAQWNNGLYLLDYAMEFGITPKNISEAFNLPLSEYSQGCYGCQNLQNVFVNN